MLLEEKHLDCSGKHWKQKQGLEVIWNQILERIWYNKQNNFKLLKHVIILFNIWLQYSHSVCPYFLDNWAFPSVFFLWENVYLPNTAAGSLHLILLPPLLGGAVPALLKVPQREAKTLSSSAETGHGTENTCWQSIRTCSLSFWCPDSIYTYFIFLPLFSLQRRSTFLIFFLISVMCIFL